MKCKRCGAEMRREKVKEHAFVYRCPKCNLTIGKQTERTQSAGIPEGKGRQK